jgi:hypothetical protein
MTTTTGWELGYNDELTATQWALNSAVECHLHTSSLFNTFNNLTRLAGTAKYLILRVRKSNERVLKRVQKGMWCHESKSLQIEFLNICRGARARTGTQSVPVVVMSSAGLSLGQSLSFGTTLDPSRAASLPSLPPVVTGQGKTQRQTTEIAAGLPAQFRARRSSCLSAAA